LAVSLGTSSRFSDWWSSFWDRSFVGVDASPLLSSCNWKIEHYTKSLIHYAIQSGQIKHIQLTQRRPGIMLESFVPIFVIDRSPFSVYSRHALCQKQA
jgi:hypothetical protein